MEQKLEVLREKINSIDKELVTLFEERMNTVVEVASYKKQHNIKVFDPEREKKVIERAVSFLKNKELERYLEYFMEELMTLSRQFQIEKIKDYEIMTEEVSLINEDSVIGFLGAEGSHSEEAASRHFCGNKTKKSYEHFDDIIKALLNMEIDAGVLPVENSSTGTITTVMDLTGNNNVYIIGEHISPIRHNLLIVPGARISDIQTVYSHHQGFEQCRTYLKQFPWKQVEYKSTADSAKLIHDLQDKTKAAIASSRCAEIYDLEIAAENINYNNNYTRFIIVGRELVVNKSCNKISVAMDIEHKPGALYNILRLFKERNINLLKIESRPIIGKPWEYLFFFDFEGNLMEDRVVNLIECLKDSVHDLRILGNYRAYKEA